MELNLSIFNLFAYLDPGSGLPFLQFLPVILGVILGFLGILLLLAKRFFKFLFKPKGLLFLIILIIIIVISLGEVFMANQTAISQKKVVIIGFDGLEPKIVERLIEEGRLPNFKKLKEEGTYTHLATTNPPESLVAWMSFATGLNPGKHGVFDFIKRNSKTYLPQLAFSDISGWKKLAKVSKGIPFWEITRKNKIPTVLIHCPNTFPPDKVSGRLLSGMGVPDIRGTMGTFSFYTTEELDKQKDIGGRAISVEKTANIINTSLIGPRDISWGKPKDIELALKIDIDEKNKSAVIYIAGKRIVLREREWSPWVRVAFRLNFFKTVYGICKFYLKSLSPEFELYISPVNFDPFNPPFPISYPKGYSKELAEELGLYSTLGMPHDTWALNEGRIDEEIFLEQADMILKERLRMLEFELPRFKKGILFCYFGSPDSIQHMFWRFIDLQNPMYEETLASKYKDVIDNFYIKMDSLLGKVIKEIDEDTTLIVLSDHGFSSFRRAVHLNSWLREKGFLYLKDDSKQVGKELFVDVDWFRTKAYSLGFGQIFINQIGREPKGIVESGAQTEKVKGQIIEELSKLYDNKLKAKVVKKVYRKNEIFSGPYLNEAPDLVAGFNEGFRASWQTALGGAPAEIIEDNKKPWAGDHLMDSTCVPGVFFSNKKINKSHPQITDIAPTILKLLGVDEKLFSNLDGKSLF